MTVESGDFDDDHDGPEPSEDPPHRPWLPPDDRLWRHPSELRSTGTPPGGVPGIRARVRRWPGGRLWTGLVLGAVVGAVIASGVISGANWLGPARTSSSNADHGGAPVTTASAVVPTPGQPVQQNHAAISAGPSLMGIVAKVWPSIVTVDVTRGQGHVRGSGLVFRSDGMVLTVARLLAGAMGISVISSSGREEAASLVGQDTDDGVAVLRVDDQLPSVALAPSPAPTTGEVAIAVGTADPVGSPPAVTIGTIKAVNQQVRENDGSPPLLDAIDTDAPPGPAPGGALLDQSGRVVGITTQTTDAGSGAHWFAAPAALVDEAADQLITSGKVEHAWLGISANDRGAAPSGGSTPAGVQVLTVQSNSPAAAAGLLPMDVIDAVDGQPVPSFLDLQGALRLRHPGAPVMLDVVRNGGHWPMRATLGSAA